MRLRLSRYTALKFQRTHAYLKTRSPAGAGNVVAAIEAAFETLRTLPLSGSEQSLPDVRMLVVRKYKYRIYYKVIGETIVVITIQHPAEKPDFKPK